jgi:probable HAF family extracellular repeat protein
MLSTNLTQLAAQSDGKGFQEFAKKVQDSAGIFRRGRILGFMLSVGMTCQLLLDAAHAQLAADKAQSGYTITDLGTLGGRFSSASGINKSGQVVGFSYITGDTASHAFLYNGKMKDLGTLGGSVSGASGINDGLQVVGFSFITGDTASHAFLYNGSTMKDLGTLGGGISRASGINNHGEVVGGAATASETLHSFLYSNGTMTDLAVRVRDSSSFGSEALGINDLSQVVGYSYFDTVNDGTRQHAVLYNGSIMKDLGVLKGDNFSLARDINNRGQVVGVSGHLDTNSGNVILHAFLYNGKMKDLGTLGGSQSRADGINNSGQVVGVSLTSGDAAFHAFLYSDDKMLDLNKLVPALSGWTLTEAFAINDVGQIVGFGTAPNGEERAFLLTPKPKK